MEMYLTGMIGKNPYLISIFFSFFNSESANISFKLYYNVQVVQQTKMLVNL